jgi:HK97 family phage major capsid protein
MTDFPGLKDAQGKLDAKRKELFAVMQEAKADGGVYDMDRIKSVSGSKADKLEWIRARNEELAPLKADVEAMKALGNAAAVADEYAAEDAERKGAESGHIVKGDQSIGALFAKSASRSRKGHVSHLDVDTKTLFQTTAGWAPESTRSGLVTLKPMVPAPSVTDHLVTLPVTQVAYKYMEETTYTNAAAGILEGGLYAESALALAERSELVQKVGTWLPVTDEQLEDEAGAEAYVNARLRNMLAQKIDQQVLQGNGTAPQLNGTVNRDGINTQDKGADTLIDAAYKMFTTIRTVGFAEPSVGFVTAADWQPVALLKTTDGIYIYGNPTSGAPSVLWGVPVVQTQAAVAGSFITGDYANYAFLGVKRGVDVQVTNTNADDFIHGKQAIRVDTRLVMVHIRPTAFGVIDLTA